MTDFPKVPEGILGEETTEKTNRENIMSIRLSKGGFRTKISAPPLIGRLTETT